MSSTRLRPAAAFTASVTLFLALLTGGAAASRIPAVASSGAVPAGGSWGHAQEVPGSEALNVRGYAGISSVSCASAGNCAAGGSYADNAGQYQTFLVSEVNGTWGKAQEVPGLAAVSVAFGRITSVSCASAGNCSAGGGYLDASGNFDAFVVSEVSRTWDDAKLVPGLAALNVGGEAYITSISCASAGNCAAIGNYADASIDTTDQAFVVNEVNGTWGNAEKMPGTAVTNNGVAGGSASSVSCASTGNCAAGGEYAIRDPDQFYPATFVVSEVNGTWGTVQEVPGLTDFDEPADITSVSCASEGNCAAGGYYSDLSGKYPAFVVSEVNGTWGTAQEVPGSASDLDVGGISSISCASAGNCSAVGDYSDGSDPAQAFTVSEVNGAWGSAQEVPGSAALDPGGNAEISSVSCASVGNCAASGYYTDPPDTEGSQAFVVSEVNGAWGNAEEVPGSAVLDAGGIAGVTSVSCPPAGTCSAGGYYTDSLGHIQAFVVSERLPLAALGDSYSSGEGAGDYYPGTGSARGCHRSPHAWPVLLHKYVTGHGVTLPDANFLACSGASSQNLSNQAFKGEQPQFKVLRKLSPKPALITLTIGGNDLGFADVLRDCYTGNCVTDGTLKTVEDGLPAEKIALEKDYNGLRDADPSATVLITGYPQIFQVQTWCEGIPHTPWGFSPDEEAALNRLTDNLDNTIAAAAAADKVHYVNVTGALAGHDLCTSDSWVTDVGARKQFFGSSQEQGHPTAPGQKAIAKIVASYVNNSL
jgi:lysophospholipase L1-like esterase